jgi:hypothetical protein
MNITLAPHLSIHVFLSPFSMLPSLYYSSQCGQHPVKIELRTSGEKRKVKARESVGQTQNIPP